MTIAQAFSWIKLRRISWAALVVCFVLPFGHGCMAPIDGAPYQAAWNYLSDSTNSYDKLGPVLAAVVSLLFLYPLLFLVWAAIERRWTGRRELRWFLQGLVLVYFAGSGWLIREGILYAWKAKPPGDISMTSLSVLGLTLLWALLGWNANTTDIAPLSWLIAFQTSAFLAGIVGWLCLLTEELLFGAWLSLIAGIGVVSSYGAEFIRLRARRVSH